MLPSTTLRPEGIVGTYRHNKRGFGFVVPTDPDGHEDLFIAEGDNAGAITGDVVRAKITNRDQREGKVMYRGRVMEIITRSQKRFVGTLVKQHGQWLVLPDGNIFIEPILTPDAAARHIKPGTTVVVELTTYPAEGVKAQGVITRALGQPGEKDVDLQSIIVQHNLPEEFPEACLDQARQAVDQFNTEKSWPDRLDLRTRSSARSIRMTRRIMTTRSVCESWRRGNGNLGFTSRTFRRSWETGRRWMSRRRRGEQLLLPGLCDSDVAGDFVQRRMQPAGRRAAVVQERVHHV